MIQQAFLGGVITLCDATELHLSFLPGCLRRPHAMKADCEAAGSTCGAVLDKVAAFTGREDAKAEAGKFVVPDEVVLLAGYGSIHDSFRELGHYAISPWRAGCFRGSTTEAAG